MRFSIRISILGFFLVTSQLSLLAADRFQVTPNHYQELDYRIKHLKNAQLDAILERPFYTHYLNENAFSFQLQPELVQKSGFTIPSLTSWIQINLTKGFILVNEMRLGYDSDVDSSYIGKEWRGASGGTNQSFIQWQKKSSETSAITFRAGRFYSQLGPGRQGQLLMGASSRPLDQIAFSYKRKLNTQFSARFYYQTAMLDKINSNKRYITLHRLELLGKTWYFNVSEALLYARTNQGMDAVYLNPFIFYHMEQLNGPDLAGNTIGTIELGYLWKANHIYSEIMIDDIQLDNEVKGDLEPNEIGILAGFEHTAEKYYLGIEGVAITNRTYKTPSKPEWYRHRNLPLGYQLGSDLGSVNILSRYYFKDNWHLDASLDLIWLGEGNFSKAWDTPWEDSSVTMETGYSESFPTGIVQQSTILSVEVLRHWTPERWLSLGLSYESIKNLDNIQDSDDAGFKLNFGASWTLDYELVFEN